MRLTLIFAVLASFAAILDARTIAGRQNDVNDVRDDVSDNVAESHVTSSTDHMSMSFVMGKTPIRLELDKNDNIPPLSTYYTAESGKLIQWTLDEQQELHAYVNHTTQDTIIMSRHRHNGSVVTGYMGSFNVDGRRYSLMTMDALKASRFDDESDQQEENRPLPMRSNTSTVYLGNLLHAIEPVRDDELGINDDTVLGRSPSAEEVVANSNSRASRQRRATGTNAAANGKRHYVIDYFVIVDFAIYDRWYRSSTATSHNARRSDAVRNIRYYYSHVVNGIDLRYSSIQHPNFAINVRFVGFMIAMSASDSVWTERSDLRITWSRYAYTDAYKSLDAVGEFIENELYRELFASVDHVALYTGNSLYNGNFRSDGSGPAVISGLAWIGSACSAVQRTSVNKEFGQYGSITTGAHELGHNVGALHDGQRNEDGPLNECSSNNQFIMAISPQTLSPSNFDNAFRFSHCSIRSFNEYINRLNNEDRNCLAERSDLPTVTDNSLSPGQQYSADEQCQQLYGPSSFYCAGGSRDALICERMECWVAELGLCYASTEQRAFDKTTCGNRRWCLGGRCVQDTAAPESTDSCVFGDYRGLYNVNNRKLSCSQMGSEMPHKCYEKNMAVDCCETCPSIRRTDIPDCEYGDRSPDECRRGRLADCYQAAYRSRCCRTCGEERGPEGCEYGDRASWCPTISRSRCYSEEKTCCQTCSAVRTGTQGCEYGDRADWCSGYIRDGSECRNPEIARLCCHACAPYVNGNVRTTTTLSPPASCADKASWCPRITRDQCYEGNDTCCATCRRLKISPPIAGCEYGDKASWCSNYVRGPGECQRPEVAQLCCLSCARYLSTQPTTTTARPSCQDNANWCPSLYAGQCYDASVERVCCATCSRHRRTSQPACRYGNKYTWCRREYCSTHANDCCATC